MDDDRDEQVDDHVEETDDEAQQDERMADEGAVDPSDELDAADDSTPQDPAAARLRESLGTMREEADRIATLDTGAEQVEAAERFAEQAGKLDEQVGAAARAADERD